jgi:methionyl-tRNA formyltransferase
MNIVLLGKGAFAIKVAKWLKKNHNLLCVVPDMPEPDWTDSLKEWSINNRCAVVESGDYGDIDESLVIDLAISVFYGKIIKKPFIDRCKNIINLHNAPLPKYRGVRPINWALYNNETYHGVTIHKIHEGIDDGDILGRVVYPIYPEVEEVIDVYNKSLEYGFLLFRDVMAKIDHCLANAVPQDLLPEAPTYYSSSDSIGLGDRTDFTRNRREANT